MGQKISSLKKRGETKKAAKAQQAQQSQHLQSGNSSSVISQQSQQAQQYSAAGGTAAAAAAAPLQRHSAPPQSNPLSNAPWTVIGSGQLPSLVQGVNPATQIVHITGFTDPMPAIEAARQTAAEKVRGRAFLTWGGDHFNERSFTVLVRDFLLNTPGGKVLAFRDIRSKSDGHADFKKTWNHLAEQNLGRFCIVEIDAQAEASAHNVTRETQHGGEASTLGDAVKFFLLGRLAVKMLGTKRVVALGGGGIVGCEMKCGVTYDQAQWTVFALSRSRQETNGTLMDAAALRPEVELVRQLDPIEARTFFHGMPANPLPPPVWAGGSSQPGVAVGHGAAVGHGFVPELPAPVGGVVGHGFVPVGQNSLGGAAAAAPAPVGGVVGHGFVPVGQNSLGGAAAAAPAPVGGVVGHGFVPVGQNSLGGAAAAAGGAAQASTPLPLNGAGFEDVQYIGYQPLHDFVRAFKPEKSCEDYLRLDVRNAVTMAPVIPFIEDIIRECKQCAQQKMFNGIAQQIPGLTHDMVFSATVFTFELQLTNLSARDENEFYRQYNNALRQRNAMVLRALAGYSHYLFSAVRLMPAHAGVLWRGIRGDEAVQLGMERYGDGMEINWSAWSSASVSRDVSKTFATAHGTDRGVLVRIETTRCARDISQLSIMPREQERVIFPNTKFVVLKPYHMVADGIGEIHLKEMSGTFTF